MRLYEVELFDHIKEEPVKIVCNNVHITGNPTAICVTLEWYKELADGRMYTIKTVTYADIDWVENTVIEDPEMGLFQERH